MLDVLMARAKRGVTSFHTPGHKNGEGIDKRLRSYTGRNLYKFDVTVFPEVDSLHDPVGPIKKAQALMAEAYGVKYSGAVPGERVFRRKYGDALVGVPSG